jgi:hypothetical protein
MLLYKVKIHAKAHILTSYGVRSFLYTNKIVVVYKCLRTMIPSTSASSAHKVVVLVYGTKFTPVLGPALLSSPKAKSAPSGC